MKVAIMQPYFFPYIGYWQLIKAVDAFVVYDDVNYINRGWINRNIISSNGELKNINLLLSGKSQNKYINEINVLNDKVYTKKLLRTIEMSYSKAPYFRNVYSLISEIINQQEKNLARYLFFSIKKICDYLDIRTELVMSSEIKKDANLRGRYKVLAICKELGADEYINPIGGMKLYSYEEFKSNQINLKFLESKQIIYKQFADEFVSDLSIIDLLMFNSLDKINEMLNLFKLVFREINI